MRGATRTLSEGPVDDTSLSVYRDPEGGLRLELRGNAARINRQFVYVKPRPGTLLLWESWLHHEVPMNRAKSERISTSFNYRWV